MAQPVAPPLPSVTDAGGLINASPSDFRAMLIFAGFLVASFIAFVIWREILSWRLAKSLDKVSEALVALKLVIVEAIAEGRAREDMRDKLGK